VAGFDSATAREAIAARSYQRRFPVPRALHATERCRRLAALALGYSFSGLPQFGLALKNVASHEGTGGESRTGLDAQLDAQSQAVLLVNASRATKLWADVHWLAVERWLADQGIASVLYCGSPSERRRTVQLAAQMQRAQVAPPSSLQSIASALAIAPIVIGLDTGLTHLAAALHAPSVMRRLKKLSPRLWKARRALAPTGAVV